jgi:hypothetical protein
LRLAERKGLLFGSNTNIVQDFAVDLLMMWEERDAVEKDVQQFKRMLGAANPQLIKTLWPDAFKDDKGTTSQTQGWSHEASMDKEEGLRLMQEIKQKKMSATLSDLDNAGWT